MQSGFVFHPFGCEKREWYPVSLLRIRKHSQNNPPSEKNGGHKAFPLSGRFGILNKKASGVWLYCRFYRTECPVSCISALFVIE